ncbi:hypothetical protein LCGC14_2900110 [marine sediment metagenome]|uniref:Homing endonuclease LAGLIDADG domain-containing protein n=1 Tax=marine sediment metagenome TaxID=412755 RepID=A0A0F8XV10_9ZZZZ
MSGRGPKGMGGPRMKTAELTSAVQMLARGAPLVEAAQKLGVWPVSLRRRLQSDGTWDNAWYARRNKTGTPTLELPENAGLLGYLAGIIDSDGHICRTSQGHWRVGVTNTSNVLIRWLRGIGGHVDKRPPRLDQGIKSRKPCFNWGVYSQNDVEQLLLAVFPFLMIKRWRAVAAIYEIRGWRTSRLRYYPPLKAAS